MAAHAGLLTKALDASTRMHIRTHTHTHTHAHARIHTQAMAAHAGLLTKALDASVYDPAADPVWRHPALLDVFAAQCMPAGACRVLGF
jgi:hypothetical protein